MTLLLIGAGGFVGAVTRYLVDQGVTHVLGAAFPWGILLVNMTGSFALGLLFAMSVEREILPSDLRAPIFAGFLGAYTTFSALTLDTVHLVERGDWTGAIANSAGSLVLGLVAVVAGLALGRQLAGS